jgi:MFS family permease
MLDGRDSERGAGVGDVTVIPSTSADSTTDQTPLLARRSTDGDAAGGEGTPRVWHKRILGAQTHQPVRHWGTTHGGKLRAATTVIGCMLMAILAGMPNAFNVFQQRVQRDMNTSDVEMSLISGFGLVGLYFVLPAGLALDHFGPIKTALVGAALMGLGFVVFSFSPNWGVLLLGLCLVSFGAGTSFLCALKVAIMQSASGGGWSVSLTSAAMSLSAAFVIFIIGVFGSAADCTQDACWRQDFRFLAVCTGCLTLPGALLLIFFNEREYPHLHTEDCDHPEDGGGASDDDDDNDDDGAGEATTIADVLPAEAAPLQRTRTSPFRKFLETLQVFKSPFFLGLMFAFFSSIGASVLVLTKTSQVWSQFNTDPDLDRWNDRILVAFSFMNAAANIVAGVGADWLERRGIMRPTTVLSIVMVIFCGVFTLCGIILMGEPSTASSYAIAALFSSVGFNFGSSLVLFPVVIGSTYGQKNFGKFFAYLQFASSAASLSVPPFATVMANVIHGFARVVFIIAGCLLVSAGLLFFIRRPNANPK